MNYGMKVNIKFENHIGQYEMTLRNVTEIHFNYSSPFEKQIAFESDIHSTGLTYFVSEIIEFETSLETKKQKIF